MDKHVSFLTKHSAENLLRAINEIPEVPGNNISFTETYVVNTPAGVYFVYGYELDRLKNELDILDKSDNYVDGKLNNFGNDIHKSLEFHEKKNSLSMFSMRYTKFIPHEETRYEMTKGIIEFLAQKKYLYYDISLTEENVVVSPSGEDIHSFTELALQSKIDADILMKVFNFTAVASEEVRVAFHIDPGGLSGAATAAILDNGKLFFIVVFSVGAYLIMRDATNEQGAQERIEHTLMHEKGHMLMIGAAFYNTGNASFIDYISAFTTKNYKDYECFKMLTMSDIKALDYYTQETSDVAIATEHYGSFTYCSYLFNKHNSMADDMIDKFKTKDKEWYDQLLGKSWNDNPWLKGAMTVQAGKTLGVDKKKLNELEKYYINFARENNLKEKEEVFKVSKTWFKEVCKAFKREDVQASLRAVDQRLFPNR